MDSGARIKNFKSLKYETRTTEEQNQIEDMIMSKMGKWKYSIDHLVQHIPSYIMEKINPRCENAIKIAKEIYEQTLRKLMPSMNDKEVKESLKKNEENLTLRFNTWLILMNDTEHVVKNATNTWKNIYVLYKRSDFFVNVSDKDDDEHEKDKEIDDKEVTHFDNIDDEKHE